MRMAIIQRPKRANGEQAPRRLGGVGGMTARFRRTLIQTSVTHGMCDDERDGR
jgi:hypothetical protein